MKNPIQRSVIIFALVASSAPLSGFQARPSRQRVCVLQTSLGTIAFKFFEADAPQTTKQFQKLVRDGFYNGKEFYRVVKGHVIQAGGGEAPKLPPEFNKHPHLVGTVGLGRDEDINSGDSEFYICVAPRPHLDGKYTVFGQLIEGTEVLEKISNVEVEEKWEGADKKLAMHKPKKPVIIEKAWIEERALSPDVPSVAKKNARVLVGPNILVSRDGEFPHVELMVAANPKKPKNLLGAAITFSRRGGDTACKAYASKDGGSTWIDSSFPEQMEFGGGDPQVAFGLNGTAYFCALSFVQDDTGRTRAGLHFYRSEDGGLSWGPKIDLGYSYDHEQIVVDHTLGKYAGRVYIATLYGYPEYQVGVFRSDDDGKTWVGPVKAASGLGKIGINGVDPLVLADETLIVPYVDFPFEPEKVKLSNTSTIWTVSSSDGGVTFSAPKKVATQVHDRYEDAEKQRKAGSFVSPGFPSVAADSGSSEFKDRLYAAWSDVRFGKPRILFSSSRDRGMNWTEPKLVSGDIPAWASQFLPEIAVNKQGVVGVTWYDTREEAATDRCRQYFAASVDGGQTFLSALPVSSEPSFPRSEINLIPVPMVFSSESDRPQPTLRLSTLSAYSRWGMGGDYLGLAAEPDGAFRVFWADSRKTAFQIYTAQVRVIMDEEKSKTGTEAGAKPGGGPKLFKTEQEFLSNQVALAYDPVRYDLKTGALALPVRLRNISGEPIYGPLKVTVKGFLNEELKKYQPDVEPNIPEVLNSANGLRGAGAVFDYGASLRDFEALDPGSVTEAVEWQLKFPNPLVTDFFIEAEVAGFVMKSEESEPGK